MSIKMKLSCCMTCRECHEATYAVHYFQSSKYEFLHDLRFHCLFCGAEYIAKMRVIDMLPPNMISAGSAVEHATENPKTKIKSAITGDDDNENRNDAG